MLNYSEYSIVEDEHLYGPGKRLLLFTQGCSLHCDGCVNTHLWEFGIGKNISAEEILQICKINNLDGITLHGGEPLDQANEIYKVVKLLKDYAFSIILFTGYQKKELSSIAIKCWDLSDMVISGRFVPSKRNIYLQFKGSTNQKVITHKGKYKNYNVNNGKTVAILTYDDVGKVNIKGFLSDDLKTLIDM